MKDAVRFTRDGFRRGYIEAQAMAIGVFFFGVTFGLLAREFGLSALEAMLMSATVYSGTAQTATVGGLAGGAGALASMITILMLNARYFLYGAALRPWLGQSSFAQAYSSLYFLGDGNWVMSMRAREQGESDAAYVLGSGMAMFLPWVGGTLLGSYAGDWIAHPRLLALDFLLVGFCAAMAFGLYRGRGDLWPLGIGLVVAFAVDRLGASGWTVVAAGLAGAVTGFVRGPQRP